jgi:hypothetical protein
MKKKVLILSSALVLLMLVTSLSDKRANQSNFEEVTIGTQVWMAKNLDVDKFRNGNPIK